MSAQPISEEVTVVDLAGLKSFAWRPEGSELIYWQVGPITFRGTATELKELFGDGGLEVQGVDQEDPLVQFARREVQKGRLIAALESVSRA